MNLKIGGNDVGKIMYNGQEFGGAAKLEPGTILYISSDHDSTISRYNDDLYLSPSTAEIIFPNVGKHWEGLKKFRIRSVTSKQVFDVNSIDEPTQFQNTSLKIHRERSLTDEPDKLIVTTSKGYSYTVMITVEEWN